MNIYEKAPLFWFQETNSITYQSKLESCVQFIEKWEKQPYENLCSLECHMVIEIFYLVSGDQLINSSSPSLKIIFSILKFETKNLSKS